MKNLTLILLMLFSNLLLAQNYANENTEKEQQEALNYLKNGNANVSGNSFKNSVYVKQEGNSNEVNANITSSDSDVGIAQIGDGNLVDLNVTAQNIDAQVQQLGNDNTFVDYSFNPQGTYQAQINQNGYNQSIYVNGTNSLSKQMKINLTGNDKTIFVNNFN